MDVLSNLHTETLPIHVFFLHSLCSGCYTKAIVMEMWRKDFIRRKPGTLKGLQVKISPDIPFTIYMRYKVLLNYQLTENQYFYRLLPQLGHRTCDLIQALTTSFVNDCRTLNRTWETKDRRLLLVIKHNTRKRRTTTRDQKQKWAMWKQKCQSRWEEFVH